MSGREWKPGDVAMLVTECCGSLTGTVNPDGTWHVAGSWHEATMCTVLDARPLVVIDPEDREQQDHLRDLICNHGGGMVDGQIMQAALREFANPKPPKPEEPTGLGAVVEAINDNCFVRDSTGDNPWRRVSADGGEYPCQWSDIAAVGVLSEGVQP